MKLELFIFCLFLLITVIILILQIRLRNDKDIFMKLLCDNIVEYNKDMDIVDSKCIEYVLNGFNDYMNKNKCKNIKLHILDQGFENVVILINNNSILKISKLNNGKNTIISSIKIFKSLNSFQNAKYVYLIPNNINYSLNRNNMYLYWIENRLEKISRMNYNMLKDLFKRSIDLSSNVNFGFIFTDAVDKNIMYDPDMNIYKFIDIDLQTYDINDEYYIINWGIKVNIQSKNSLLGYINYVKQLKYLNIPIIRNYIWTLSVLMRNNDKYNPNLVLPSFIYRAFLLLIKLKELSNNDEKIINGLLPNNMLPILDICLNEMKSTNSYDVVNISDSIFNMLRHQLMISNLIINDNNHI